MLVRSGGRDPATVPATPTVKINQEEILLFLEAISIIQDKALLPGPKKNISRIIDDALKAYLNRADPFSDFISRDEYLKIQALDQKHYVGIGMEIKKDHRGRVICFPYPAGPAARSGIRAGDRLERIDGVDVDKRSLFTLAAMSKGERGTVIELQISTPQGRVRRIKVTRQDVSFESVTVRRYGKLSVIEIKGFARSTKDRLQQVLEVWPPDRPVIIDLRGNSGGDLHAAIDTSMYFLDAGNKVAIIKEIDHTTVYRTSGRTMNLSYPVYLWQSGTTASGAEVFIAALTENGKGVSIGVRTFGKGTKQDIIPLQDGSALILTTGRLLTPTGHPFDGLGLPPQIVLKGSPPSSADYLSEVQARIAATN